MHQPGVFHLYCRQYDWNVWIEDKFVGNKKLHKFLYRAAMWDVGIDRYQTSLSDFVIFY